MPGFSEDPAISLKGLQKLGCAGRRKFTGEATESPGKPIALAGREISTTNLQLMTNTEKYSERIARKAAKPRLFAYCPSG